MELVVAFAIAVLTIIFVGSVVALGLICRHRFYAKQLDEKPILKYSKDENSDGKMAAHFGEFELDDVLQLSPNIEKILKEKTWMYDTSGLVEHCLSILRTCHWMTDKLSGLSFSPVHGNQAVMDEVRLATRRVMPRVDDLVRAMYSFNGKGVQATLLEARAAALILATNNLVLAFRAAYPTAVENVEWLRVALSDLEMHLQQLREASQSEELQCQQLKDTTFHIYTLFTLQPAVRYAIADVQFVFLQLRFFILRMPFATLAIVFGIPACGKTSLCKRIVDFFNADESNRSDIHVVHICYDEILEYAKLCTNQWKSMRNMILDSIDAVSVGLNSRDDYVKPAAIDADVWNKIVPLVPNFDATWSKIIFLIDDNMYYRSMRFSYYRLARKHQFGFCQLYIQCDLERALIQNRGRKPDAVVSDETIKRMAEKIQMPAEKWEENSYTVIVDNSDSEVHLSKIGNFLLESFSKFLPELSEDANNDKLTYNVESCTNRMHRLDLLLRGIIHQEVENKLSHNELKEKKLWFRRLSRAKQSLMNMARADISLDENDVQMWRIMLLDRADLLR
ncbi:putative L-seryl-tRNA(Sec) kinase [Trichinella nativa]|uniref:Putative L-seryl-tRNA(Sec) kinase n=1 Tax=Trichinella nativa TaxID=6335 RepID=A0A1Y3EPX0_9BILA|nr:putative L-seryl-tRNA(Sec) kinase [Trichinella nativa]